MTKNKSEETIPDEVNLPGYKPIYEGNVKQIKLATDAINTSEKPVVYAGGGIIISGADKELMVLAEKANLPVTTTLLGLGGFPGSHDLHLGMLGMHGTAYANKSIQASDLIIAVGARFDDRITGKIEAFAPNAKIVHVDIDPTSISKNIQVDIPVVGDAKNILAAMVKFVKKNPREKWLKQIAAWKKEFPLAYDKKSGLKPQFVVQEICRLTPDDAIIATEVGQNQMWTAQWYTFNQPRTLLSSGGLGTMGYGFPAAMGAQVGCPDRVVFDIAGDGSIQMNIQEMATVVANNIPVKIAILNNGFLGMVRQWQELFYDKRYVYTKISSPDFVALAEADGAKGLRVKEAEDVEGASKEALGRGGTVRLGFVVEPEAMVVPMVPAGEAMDRMIGGMT